ncbi:S8 family serine peptidase [Streptomyces sp. NPDC050844]|uniref:S8 family serine peptidase n=1 Tax=Streptomyces sp. NPDC050844 TaxID=3155790 RepID=UPI0033F6B8A4
MIASWEADAVRRTLRQAGLAGLRNPGAAHGTTVALLDGPIVAAHPALADAAVCAVGSAAGAEGADQGALTHATFLASILVGDDPRVLGVCTGARLVSIPVADPALLRGRLTPRAVSQRLNRAIWAAVEAGADVILCGLVLSPAVEHQIAAAVEAAARAGVWSVFPAGNSGGIRTSELFSTPGVIPVAFTTHRATPHPLTTWGVGIARSGLLAPGTDLPGALSPTGYGQRSGSSFAAALVAGSFALLRALTHHRVERVWGALLDPYGDRMEQLSLMPRLLDVRRSHNRLIRS